MDKAMDRGMDRVMDRVMDTEGEIAGDSALAGGLIATSGKNDNNWTHDGSRMAYLDGAVD